MPKNKKNLVIVGFLASVIIITGAGCQKTEELPLYDGWNQVVPNEASETNSSNDTKNKVSNPEKTATKKIEPQAQDGTATVKFINKISGYLIPGHMTTCLGCTNGEIFESNINGEVTLKFKTGSPVNLDYYMEDWYHYNTIKDIKPGDNIVVKTNPQVVGQEIRIFFPKASYTKNAFGKTQLHITYKDETGLPKTNSPIILTGPIVGNGRKTAWGITDTTGKAIIDLPINGSYRISLGKDFFQFEAPTGYNVNLTLDYSKLNDLVSGTKELSKNSQERGMMLVCVRDRATNKSLSASIMKSDGTIVTGYTKYNDDICIEVPKSEDRVGVMPTNKHSGIPYTSTASVDSNGVLYLYVDAI